MSHVITHAAQLGGSVKEFHLRRKDGAPLPGWKPGSHIVLRFADAGGKAYENHYSLIGMPGPADSYRIAVQREEHGKGGSRTLHDEFGPGREVALSGPFNSFPLLAQPPSQVPPRTLLIAGGIGITPMVSMAHALGARGQSFELHYLAHSRDKLVLMDELRTIPHGAMTEHISQESGRADLTALLGAYHEGDSFYACGPAPLLQALAAASAQQGWPASAMHFESFGARAQPDDAPLTVELSLSQITLEVQPGTPILDALIAADIFVSYDCKRGECGSCYTQVLEGQPLHRDVCLTPSMRTTGMCTCVSWAAPGRLVLEL
ncbi:PDR/VanB family oxidoreductase [Pseudoduganella aquatica]|uniref:2Fe-2S iron-sulfur cluster binding domain-containing protein n=1 Tax=Pseudoduganella aquatica TaxID=2660641 RepID=A0A7X4HC25_9BURK|nr:PDR/VanB family oxidoreductase [Pseudoduganella aquatica]MYN07505.1 2Fe-2S iron-sulfur cluster binding domain-containing protein [Pseudoduganella aquatica]